MVIGSGIDMVCDWLLMIDVRLSQEVQRNRSLPVERERGKVEVVWSVQERGMRLNSIGMFRNEP